MWKTSIRWPTHSCNCACRAHVSSGIQSSSQRYLAFRGVHTRRSEQLRLGLPSARQNNFSSDYGSQCDFTVKYSAFRITSSLSRSNEKSLCDATMTDTFALRPGSIDSIYDSSRPVIHRYRRR